MATDAKAKSAMLLQDYYNSMKARAHTQEQIDLILIANQTFSSKIVKKIPRYLKEPVFLVDGTGEKVPLTDNEGNIVCNRRGEMQFVIKEWKKSLLGYVPVIANCSGSEVFTPDMTSSNINDKQMEFIWQSVWYYNWLQTIQENSEEDYSYDLHRLRNDIYGVILPTKSLRGAAGSLVKTFRNIMVEQPETALQALQNQKPSLMDKLIGKKPDQQKQQMGYL